MFSKLSSKLKNDGFIIYKNAVAKKEINYFFKFFKNILSTYSNSKEVLAYNSFEDLRLHNFLINLKKKKPKVFKCFS